MLAGNRLYKESVSVCLYCSKGISMKKNYYLCGVLVAIATIALASCGTPQYTTEQIIDKTRIDNTVWTPELDKQDSRIKFYRQTASYMDEESGWYFQFCREGSRLDPTEYFYTFHGLNLRYRYADDNWSVRYIQDQKADGTPVFRRIKTKPGVLHFGQGGPEEKEDREVIDSILHSCPTPEELLKENPDQYEFKIVDKLLKRISFEIYVVFTLEIRTANGLASAPHACLPLSAASNNTVPVPQKGSKTIPP